MCCRKFMNPFKMNNDFIEVRIFFLKLLFIFLFVKLHNLLLNPNDRSAIFSSFFLHVFLNHISERRLRLDQSYFCESSNNNILQCVFKFLNFSHICWVLSFICQMLGHNHNVIEWKWFILLYRLLLEC